VHADNSFYLFFPSYNWERQIPAKLSLATLLFFLTADRGKLTAISLPVGRVSMPAIG
jgi:hypothetical protein